MSKEHAYAYEAGYRDGSINYELEHCPACKNVADLQEALDENAKLQNENARLRSCLSDDSENARMIMGENAKLRELVQTLVHCLNDVDCDKCPLNGNPYEVRGEWAACDALLDCMRELGIEAEQ